MEKLEKFFKESAKMVDPKIKEVLEDSVDKKTRKLVDYQIEVGGKRLRPVLAISSCLICGGKIKDVLYPAAGLEILHNCTLIYDDIIDNSLIRREEPTCWVKFGRSIAECVGIDYGVATFQAANKSINPSKINKIFSKTLKKVVDGEIMDILFEQSGRKDEKYINGNRYNNITLNDYLKMVEKKTAALIEACCETGGVAAGAKEPFLKALKNYGYNLGIAFQIKDDILDVYGKQKELGKRIGTDIKERKLGNIVIFYALKELPETKRKKIINILKKKKILDKDVKEVINIIKKTRAKERSFLLAQQYIKKAKNSLKTLPKNKWNRVLADLADFIIERNK